MSKIDELYKKINDLQADCNDLYAEVRHYEKLSDVDGMSSYSDEVKLFIDTYEMLKNDYLKGYITEDDFFDDMDLNINRMKKDIKTGGAE